MNNMTFVCPEGHKTVLDEEKSNENWQVFKDPCPECGKKLELVILNDYPLDGEGSK